MTHRDAPRPRPSHPQKVSELVPEVLNELGLGDTSNAVGLLRVWDSVLGERFAPHCRPDGIRHGVIYARVRDSGWMQRIQLEKSNILARLEEAMGEPIARDLRFRVGDLGDVG